MEKAMIQQSKFQQSLNSGSFTITSEIGPPKGVDVRHFIEHTHLLKDRVHAINITDNQGANMRMSSLGGAIIIKQQGGEPIFQVTCRDRNRIAIGSDLLAAKAMGIHNVLCLTGDFMNVGDHVDAAPVFDLDSVQLIQGVHNMSKGIDFGGNKMDTPANFFCGAAFSSTAQPQELQMIKMAKKINAGAQFVQTQAVFEKEPLINIKKQKIFRNTKVLAGVLLLSGPGMAKFVNNNLPGINIPPALIKELTDSPKGKRLNKGIEIASRFIRELKEEKICDGVHIMAIGKENVVPEILDQSGISCLET